MTSNERVGDDERRKVRFEKYVVKGPGCWTWTGARMRTGYGSFRWASYVRDLAHRAAWRIYVGTIQRQLLRTFDRLCDRLWWLPGIPQLWAFVANRTFSPWDV
jgi:hypothetical protein